MQAEGREFGGTLRGYLREMQVYGNSSVFGGICLYTCQSLDLLLFCLNRWLHRVITIRLLGNGFTNLAQRRRTDTFLCNVCYVVRVFTLLNELIDILAVNSSVKEFTV